MNDFIKNLVMHELGFGNLIEQQMQKIEERSKEKEIEEQLCGDAAEKYNPYQNKDFLEQSNVELNLKEQEEMKEFEAQLGISNALGEMSMPYIYDDEKDFDLNDNGENDLDPNVIREEFIDNGRVKKATRKTSE